MAEWKLFAVFLCIELLVSVKSHVQQDLTCPGFVVYNDVAEYPYYPSDDDPVEGSAVDKRGLPLQTLQDFLEGKSSYVSAAMDSALPLPYGQPVCIPELNQAYGVNIPFQIDDTAQDLVGTEYTRINICVRDLNATYDPILEDNLFVTLVFPPDCEDGE